MNKKRRKEVIKDNLIRFRVSDSRKEEVVSFAKSKGLTISSFLNGLVDQALEQAAV